MPAELQSSDDHKTLLQKPNVSKVLAAIIRRRTLTLKLNDDEAMHYFDEDGEVPQLDGVDLSVEQLTQTLPSPVEGSAQNDAVLTVMQQMMASQQESINLMMQTFQDSMESLQSKCKVEVTRFDGKKEEAKIWMVTFERAAEANHWTTNRQKINHLKGYLEGIALKWYNSRVMEDADDDWSQWRDSFIKAFGQNRIILASNANKWEYRGGPIMDYYYEKQRLLQLAYPELNEYNFITLMILGLPEDLQMILTNQSLSTREELREAMERLKTSKGKEGKINSKLLPSNFKKSKSKDSKPEDM